MVIEKRLRLAEHMVKLRSLEMSDAVEFIAQQLESHLENLKGDYLIGIIKNIR